MTIYPGEQVVESKFDEEITAGTSALPIKETESAVSVNLTDPARVAGFVNPGSEVAIYYSAIGGSGPFTRLLLDRVTVIGVGSTTPAPASTDHDHRGGRAGPGGAPPDAADAVAGPEVLGEGHLRPGQRRARPSALLTEESKIDPGPGITSANLFE